MKKKARDNFFKVLFIMLFISYMTIFISQKSGYVNFQNYKKTALTKEKIMEFEKDVKNGKNINLEDYKINTKKNYSNKLSNVGYSISKGISTLVYKGVSSFFDTIGKLAKE